MGNIKIAGEDAKLGAYNYTINFDPEFLEYKSSEAYTEQKDGRFFLYL